MTPEQAPEPVTSTASPALPFLKDGAFDLDAFEAHVEARTAARPDLAQAQQVAGATGFAVALLGLALLVRRVLQRRSLPPAPGPPAEPGWGIGLALLLLLGFPLVGSLALRMLQDAGAPDTLAIRLAAGALGIALLAALGLVLASSREGGLAAFGLGGPSRPGGGADAARPTRLQAAGTGLLYLLMVMPIVIALQLGSHWLSAEFGLPRAPNPAAGLFVATSAWSNLALVAGIAVLIAPVTEEVLFRGLLYLPLRKRMGRGGAIALSALLFAIVHPPVDMPAIFALGVALALAYERTGSLAAPLALHVGNNLYGVCALVLQRHLAWG